MKGKKIVSIVMALAIAITCLGVVGFIPKELSTKAQAANPFTIVLDSGHAPSQAGNANRMVEAEVNELLTIEVYRALVAQGFNVYLTGTLYKDQSIPAVHRNTVFPQREQYSITNVLKPAINIPWEINPQYNKRPDLALTLHHNDSAPSVNGMEVYYSSLLENAASYGKNATTVANAKSFATMLGNQLRGTVTQLNARNPLVRDQRDFTFLKSDICRDSVVPTVLLEAAYLTSPQDVAVIKAGTYRAEIASAVVKAVTQYANSVNTGDKEPPTATGVAHSGSPTSNSAFSVEAFGVKDNVGVKEVKFAVWHNTLGQAATLKWINAINLDGKEKWGANIAFKDLGGNPGDYTIEAYGTDNAGNTGFLGRLNMTYTKTQSVPKAEAVLNSGTPTGSNVFSVEAHGVTAAAGIKDVMFAVWYKDEPQGKTLKWSNAANLDGKNKWGANILFKDYGNKPGEYCVEAYATDKDGNRGFLGRTYVVYQKEVPKATAVLHSGSPTAGTAFSVEAHGVTASAGIKNVMFATWYRDEPQAKTLKWTNAANLDGKNKWGANILFKDYGNKPGVYCVEVYATDNDDTRAFLGRMEVKYEKNTTPPTATGIYNSGSPTSASVFSVETHGVTSPAGIAEVRYAVWLSSKPQGETLRWINATNLDGAGKWGANIPLSQFGGQAGIYSVEAYATDKEGTPGFLGRTAVEYKQTVINPTDDASVDTILNSGGGAPIYTNAFAVEVYGAKAKAGVSGINFVVTNLDNGKAQTIGASNLGNRWGANIALSAWGDAIGNYNVDVYIVDGAGKSFNVGKTVVDVRYINPSQYAIMGSATTTPQDLYNFYVNKVGLATYPYDYTGINLMQFCQLYHDTSLRYGIKPDLAFAQMVHETNFLKFTGDVKAWQFNFAGLGATGGGKPGSDFVNIPTGITAHVQHLFCYASTAPCPETIVDTRWSNSLRGTATTLEALSGKWATGLEYGNKIMRYIGEIKSVAQAKAMAEEAPVVMQVIAETPNTNGENNPIGMKEPTKSPEPTQTVDPTKSPEPTQTADPTKSPEPTQAAGPTKSPEPTQTAEPTKSPEPTQTVDPMQSPKPTEEADSTQSPKPTEETAPTSSPEITPETADGYTISGQAGDTVRQQLLDILTAKVEESTLASTDTSVSVMDKYGITAEQFVDMYIEQAQIEGIKPQVAFMQAMVETDFLTFSTNPQANIYDIGGLKDAEIADLKTGIIMQIQHLKCLATTEECVGENIDKLWSEELRNTAPTVEKLQDVWSDKQDYSTAIVALLNTIVEK